ncbi:MAG: hypothetical protein M1826_004336 [Phylliscum demangeonii]|nr:MAG: hypothetical protein M1826_004336 [Phylliscum demangeonii]
MSGNTMADGNSANLGLSAARLLTPLSAHDNHLLSSDHLANYGSLPPPPSTMTSVMSSFLRPDNMESLLGATDLHLSSASAQTHFADHSITAPLSVPAHLRIANSLEMATQDLAAGEDLPVTMYAAHARNGSTASVQSVPTVDTSASDLVADTPSSSKRKSKGGATPASVKRKKTSGPTRLRKGQQIISAVPLDVWENILSYCPAKFLARARRINHSFNHLLHYESAWKRNRLQNHGADMPGPLPNMKEDEYANLLEGLGCMDCGARKTRKAYWLWRKRWCIECFAKSTVKEDAALRLTADKTRLLQECVPFGILDSWGRYEMAGYYEKGWTRSCHGRSKIYGKADIARLVAEWEEMMQPDESGAPKTQDQVSEWLDLKRAERDRVVKAAQQAEHWVEKSIRDRVGKNVGIKQDRAAFFEERAKALDPPLDPSALKLIQAYKRSVEIARPPSERAWKALLPKVEQERAAAQHAIAERRERLARSERESKERSEYMRMVTRRATGDSVEQRLIGTMADDVLKELDERMPPVADTDYVLLALRGVRQRYYQIAEDFAARLEQPLHYRLLMEDARWVLEKKISLRLHPWGPVRCAAALLFKCPGCPRTDTHLKYTFDSLLCHLRKKHASPLGEFKYLSREALEHTTTLHWLSIEWPINLPVLAVHHVATGKWDPHDASPYLEYRDPAKYGPTSAYDGRRVCHGGPATPDPVRYITHAGALLDPTPLEGKYKTSIVLRFAVEKSRAFHVDPSFAPPVTDLANLPLTLIRAGLFDIFDRFKCAACVLHGADSARDTLKVHSVGSLIQHFTLKHASRDWTQEMLKLPDDRELWAVLTRPGMETALKAFETLFPPCDVAGKMADVGSVPGLAGAAAGAAVLANDAVGSPEGLSAGSNDAGDSTGASKDAADHKTTNQEVYDPLFTELFDASK